MDLNPSNTFYSVKRIIGLKYKHFKKDLKAFNYTVHEGRNGEALCVCPLLENKFRPEVRRFKKLFKRTSCER